MRVYSRQQPQCIVEEHNVSKRQRRKEWFHKGQTDYVLVNIAKRSCKYTEGKSEYWFGHMEILGERFQYKGV